MAVIAPFRIDVPEPALVDLRERLERARWPEAQTVMDWSQGVPSAYMRELCDYWRAGYDWRRVERQLNAQAQFRVELDDLQIHFLHVRAGGEGAGVVGVLQAVGLRLLHAAVKPPADGGLRPG